jgi:hypothetical protein
MWGLVECRASVRWCRGHIYRRLRYKGTETRKRYQTQDNFLTFFFDSVIWNYTYYKLVEYNGNVRTRVEFKPLHNFFCRKCQLVLQQWHKSHLILNLLGTCTSDFNGHECLCVCSRRATAIITTVLQILVVLPRTRTLQRWRAGPTNREHFSDKKEFIFLSNMYSIQKQ